jgi:proline racemase
VLFIEVSGCLPMCGHGTIGVATVLVETGMVDVKEPITTVRLETPAGLVTATVRVEDGVAKAVTIENVPAFAVLDQSVDGIDYDLPSVATSSRRQHGSAWPHDGQPKREMLDGGTVVNGRHHTSGEPVHPLDPVIHGCHHVYLAAPDASEKHSRHAWRFHPGWFDRSPCGTGTSARMAQPARARAAAAGDRFRQRVHHRHALHRSPSGHHDRWVA